MTRFYCDVCGVEVVDVSAGEGRIFNEEVVIRDIKLMVNLYIPEAMVLCPGCVREAARKALRQVLENSLRTTATGKQ